MKCLYLTGFLALNLSLSKISAQDSLVSWHILIDSISLEADPLVRSFGFQGGTLIIDRSNNTLAATFQDPSRSLLRYPGIGNANDQANGIIYRGWSPELVRWSMHGAYVVNPNHLSNAGTVSDLFAPSSGGVLMVPFEHIRRFRFDGQPVSPGRINALNGVMDLAIGSPQENFLRVGLLGMETSLTGPGEKSAVHARYSTVGLLSDLGVDFDGEEIRYMDLSFRHQCTDKISFFVLGGRSSNMKARVSGETAMTLKDISEIDYNADIFMAGTNVRTRTGEHSLVFSRRNEGREQIIDAELYDHDPPVVKAGLDQRLISYHGNCHFGHNLLRGLFRASMNATFESTQFFVSTLEAAHDRLLLTPSISFRRQWNRNNPFITILSIGAEYDSGTGQILPAPYVSAALPAGRSIFEFSSGMTSHEPGAPLSAVSLAPLKRSRIWTAALSWKYHDESRNGYLLSRVFINRLFDLPSNGSFSPLINGLDSYLALPLPAPVVLSMSGKARNVGVEMMADKTLTPWFKLNINASFYNAEYLSGSEWRSARFNFQRIFNVVGSYRKKIKGKNQLMISGTFHNRGGAIDQPSSVQAERLDDYYRVDLRIAYQWNNRNEMVLDIQNLTGRINAGYTYYDPFAENWIPVNQLGMIPLLSYKRNLNK